MTPSFEPREFGRYYLVDKIAVGGMAEVFKAKSYAEGGFEKLLVIKRILGHLSDNEEFVEMFIDEAKISVELQHPNIVQIFDFGKTGENWYIAMELVEGKDTKNLLRRLARRRKLMPPEFAMLIAHEVCKGLHHAHEKTDLDGNPLHIVHRDISPSNIIVGYRGDVKVADFGIAKAEKSTYTTKDGVLKGKFEYMSPEQARGEAITAQSDLFAVGIILHEMLTGRRLFKCDSDVATLEKIKAGDVPRPSSLNPGVPAAVDALVMKALATDPADRFKTARQMQAALLENLYPHTPDTVREQLGRFMGELFAEDIAEERSRLQAGSARADALRTAAPPPEEDSAWVAPATGATAVQPAPSRAPLFLAGAVVVLLLAVVAVLALREPQKEIVEVKAAAEVPTMGVLQLVIKPEDAVPTVVLGGKTVSEGQSRVTVDEVAPDTAVTLMVTAEGFEPFTDEVQAAAGERLRLPITLQRAAKPPPDVAPKPTPVATPVPDAPDPGPSQPEAVASVLTADSSPAGAEVVVNGRSVGRTPTTWRGAEAGERYTVEFRLAGHKSVKRTVTVPSGGGAVRAAATLKPVAQDPGEVFVNVKGGWGEVWIDGKKIDTTPLKHSLSPGKHTVKVVNSDAGLEETRTVTIQSGKTQRLTFSL